VLDVSVLVRDLYAAVPGEPVPARHDNVVHLFRLETFLVIPPFYALFILPYIFLFCWLPKYEKERGKMKNLKGK